MSGNDINTLNKMFLEFNSQVWERNVKSQSQSIDFDQQ